MKERTFTALKLFFVLVLAFNPDFGQAQLAPVAWSENQLDFDVGPSLANPSLNYIHFVDRTNDRLLTLDTATGKIISAIHLQGKPGPAALMCYSLDGNTLYVPLTSSQKIQIISIPDLI